MRRRRGGGGEGKRRRERGRLKDVGVLLANNVLRKWRLENSLRTNGCEVGDEGGEVGE